MIGLRATPVSIAACATAGGHDRNKARIERHGNQIVTTKTRARALIGARDIVGHILARELGQGAHRGDLHFHIDRLGAHIERAAEDVGKAEDVIDLVRIIRPASRDDGVRPHRVRVLRRDFRIGIGHGENDRIGGHGLDHVLRQRALGG